MVSPDLDIILVNLSQPRSPQKCRKISKGIPLQNPQHIQTKELHNRFVVEGVFSKYPPWI